MNNQRELPLYTQQRPLGWKSAEGPLLTDTVEKLCFEKSGDFICVLSVFPYSRYEGIVRNT